MKTSATGRAFIEVFEGKFLRTYDDGTGVLTIGYGHTTAAGAPAVTRGMTITDEECDSILAADLSKVEADVERIVKVPLSQNQFDALVSFHFNTGALGTGTVDNKLNAGNTASAMDTLLQYDHAGGRQMDGLTRRRQAERLMFVGQVAAAMKLAGAKIPTETVMPQKVDRAPSEAPVGAPAPSVPKPATAPPTGLWAAFTSFLTRKV
jgi:lysozyme